MGYLAVSKEMIMNALSNTIVGMGVVFVILIVIALIISSLKIVPKILDAKEAKKATKSAGVVVTEGPAEVTPQTVIEQIDPMADLELTAVIMAAIEAYISENGSGAVNGLNVRSIRRVRH